MQCSGMRTTVEMFEERHGAFLLLSRDVVSLTPRGCRAPPLILTASKFSSARPVV